jgi:hypothetical protein
MLPTTWVFWPIGVYNTLDPSVGTAWIERWYPAHAEAFDALQNGESEAQAGHFEEAARDYSKSTNLYSTPKAWYGLGTISARQDCVSRRRNFLLSFST